jgi:ABC-type siderophore export system fused ATPase/permease subunit
VLLDVCRETDKTLLAVSHDDEVIAAGDRLVDMATLTARAERAA